MVYIGYIGSLEINASASRLVHGLASHTRPQCSSRNLGRRHRAYHTPCSALKRRISISNDRTPAPDFVSRPGW
jgi:hypothetical protein